MADIPRNPLFNPMARQLPPATGHVQSGFRPSPDPFRPQPTWLFDSLKPAKPKAVGEVVGGFNPSPDPFKPQPGWLFDQAKPRLPKAVGEVQTGFRPSPDAFKPQPTWLFDLPARVRLKVSESLYWTTPTAAAVVVPPFFQTDWPLPARAKPKATEYLYSRAPINVPFFQTDWPLPARQRSKASEYLYSRPPINLPFAQYDWPLPAKFRSTNLQQDIFQTLVQTQIVPPVAPVIIIQGAGHPPKRIPGIKLRSGRIYQPQSWGEFRRLIAAIEFRTGQKPMMALPGPKLELQSGFSKWSAEQQLLSERQRLMLDEEEAALALLLLSME